VDDISHGLAESRFTVATLEAAMLYVLGLAQTTLVRVTQDAGESLAISLAQQMCALLLRGLGLPGDEADLIAAQASDEIVRRGAFATVQQPAGTTH
jgi:hypothetical protein